MLISSSSSLETTLPVCRRLECSTRRNLESRWQKWRDAIRPGEYLILTSRGYDHRGCCLVHDLPGRLLWVLQAEAIAELVEDAGSLGSRLHDRPR